MDLLYVVLGLGLVIFFHELGHFAVAKWCDVNVERFSIGFGPIIWSRKWGETEYALSLVPFGGYVKMLGQDDMDPSQLTSEEIAEDPRSYSAKAVWQRMLIISAGVIMNVITGMLFYASAFSLGVQGPPARIGSVVAGGPAWEAGLEYGDVIRRINGRKIATFLDISRAVVLSHGDVVLEGKRRNGDSFKVTITPDSSGTRRTIGVRPSQGLEVATSSDPKVRPVMPGGPAAAASPAFESGDRIRRIDELKLERYPELLDYLAKNRDKKVDYFVQRGDDEKPIKISVDPNPFKTLGLWMDIERVASIRKDSPAYGELEVGDRIARVNGFEVGREINPLQLPDFFADAYEKNESVEIEFSRQIEGGESKNLTVNIMPENGRAWTDQLVAEDEPIAIPSIGIAYHVTTAVLKVEDESPAEKAGIPVGIRITQMELIRDEDADADLADDKVVTIRFDEEDKEKTTKRNWAHAFWLMQLLPLRTVKLTDSDKKTYELKPAESDDWFVPMRGLQLASETITQKAGNVQEAFALGLTHTRNSLLDIYRTLRSLASGGLSVKELHGPVGIAKVAWEVAKMGIAPLLLFLGFLSVNLAVLNFLPIPVLDGGHMVFLCWEAIARRKPSERVLAAATWFGFAFVIGLMLFVLYLDLFVNRLAVN